MKMNQRHFIQCMTIPAVRCNKGIIQCQAVVAAAAAGGGFCVNGDMNSDSGVIVLIRDGLR